MVVNFTRVVRFYLLFLLPLSLNGGEKEAQQKIMFNWTEIQPTLQPISQILIPVGLFFLLYLTLTFILLIFSYLWLFSLWVAKISWANLKAPFASKPSRKTATQPQEPTPAPNHHEPAK